MRILQICSAREIGGGEKHLADLANTLAQRGQQIFVALGSDSPVRAELPSVPSENILELPMRNALSVRSALRLARLVREQQIQIIHAHLARDYPLAALAAGRTGAQLVLTRHVLFPLKKIHRLTLRRTARVIGVSQAVADGLRAGNIFPEERIVTIHNGIDLGRFSPASPRDGNESLRVGMVGHLAPIKGPEEFVRAAAIVCRELDDVAFVIAGEDKSATGENRAHLEKLIRDLRLEDRIQLTGWVDEIPELLHTFDLFVSPSQAEPFGLSIVEAMASGVPVIATASEGASEILFDHETGRLVEIGDFAGLANEIIDLLNRPNERSRLAGNALRVAREKFSVETMVDRTEAVYREVLERD